MRTLKLFLLLSSAVIGFSTFLLTSPLYGQGISTGDLHVSVIDPQGQPIADASVSAKDTGKGTQREASANEPGEYGILALPPASYIVTVKAQGFSPATEYVTISVGSSPHVVIALRLGTSTEIIDVTADSSDTVEHDLTSARDTVSQEQILNLPTNGRSALQSFATLNSQVEPDATPETGAAPTSGLNVSGQRGRSNGVNCDGADTIDNSTNGVRSCVPLDAVQEFQIITNGYGAEYGRAAGGVVNIITRSGNNSGFHGDVFGYLRNRNFQAVNPFSTVPNPAYTRVQGGVSFGGPIKKDKTFYFFSYEVTRRHETGFSSIGANNFGLVPFNTAQVGMPFGTLQLTQDQINFLQNPATQAAEANNAFLGEVQQYIVLTGASSGQAIQGAWPSQMVQVLTGGGLSSWAGFPTTCQPPGPCVPVPSSYQTLASQMGNFPVFEGTSLYSLRLDHNLSDHNGLTLRVSVSPSTVNGIEVSGQDQPFGQNAYSRTSQQTYRDVAGVFQDRWVLSNNKVNEFLFQYARRGLSYFYNTAIPGGSDPAVNIPGFAYFGREPYSYIQRVEQRYQFTDNLTWVLGKHTMKFGGDFNYIPLKAIFTVNYGGVYDFGAFSASSLGFTSPSGVPAFPQLSPIQSYGAGLPGDFIQGLGSPSDSFTNIPIGMYWQDTWKVRHNLTVNYGARYDIEIPPSFRPPSALAVSGYNFLGLQKGIQTDRKRIQPRVGFSWDPKGDGKTAVRASYGIFSDHPLLGLYFLGDASDGSTSGQLAFGGTGLCSNPGGAGNPANLNAIPIFQGLPINSTSGACAVSNNPAVASALGYLPNQQQFQSLNFPQSAFLNQNYLNPSTFLPLGFQPFGYPQGKNFVYAYSQQANFTIERDLGHHLALSVAYIFNGGRHLNRPINANTIRGDLMVNNLLVAQQAAQAVGIQPGNPNYPTSPFTVGTSTAFQPCGLVGGKPYVPAALMNFFRPGGLNPSIAEGLIAAGGGACVGLAEQMLQGLKGQGFNTACDPFTSLNNCVPFGDMDANFSNGSSVYHGLTTNLRKKFSGHYEMQASYTWSHAIDDSTDLEATLTPQDSYFPARDRASSTFDQRHRFVFSGIYHVGHVGGEGFTGALLSDWTFSPIIEFASGRPFNIITGSGDNLQLSSLTGRPNTFANPACGSAVNSKFSPTGVFQEPCIFDFNGTLASLDGNLGRNAGTTPWTVFNDLRIARNIKLREKLSIDAMLDIFNIANRYNVAAVSPLFNNAGVATAAYDPRQLQIGLKVNW
jgi:Carboxypeptidase regulatory-like domain/TonB-dependent Receptor Plug Domain